MVDVAFTPAESSPAPVTIVIDVLRATSTIVQALDSGYERVICADSIERARRLAQPGRVLAGERRCVRPPGFTLGNSPAEMTRPRGEELVLATTNGTPAVMRAAELSPTVLVGCMLNLDAVVEAAVGSDVQLLCSGTDGRPALEDVYVAGRIAARLPGRHSDAALAAGAVALAYPIVRDALAASADGAALRAAGLEADIDWCARESVTSLVPRLHAATAGVCTLTASYIEEDLHIVMSDI